MYYLPKGFRVPLKISAGSKNFETAIALIDKVSVDVLAILEQDLLDLQLEQLEPVRSHRPFGNTVISADLDPLQSELGVLETSRAQLFGKELDGQRDLSIFRLPAWLFTIL